MSNSSSINGIRYGTFSRVDIPEDKKIVAVGYSGDPPSPPSVLPYYYCKTCLVDQEICGHYTYEAMHKPKPVRKLKYYNKH